VNVKNNITMGGFISAILTINILIATNLIFGKNIGKKDYTTNKINLEGILKKCSDYCERLDNIALFFICKEKIEEVILHPRRKINMSRSAIQGRQNEILGAGVKFDKEKNKYEYDYQLIREGPKTIERRTLIEENGKKKHVENALLKTKRFKYERVILGPIGLLSKNRQKIHDYMIIGENKVNGLDAFIIEAIPNQFSTLDHTYGKIWISKKDFSILKIEWYQESIGNYSNLAETARKLNAIPKLKITSEYFLEKNGIRFPSKHIVWEEYKKKDFTFLQSYTIIKYSEYKFFIVETEVRFK
jgi:hypothetical protein